MLLYRIKICSSSLGPTLRYPPFFFHHPRVKIAWFFAWEPPFQTWTSPISHGMSLSYVRSIHQLKHVETTFESCPKKNSPQWHNSPIVVKTLMNSSLSCGRPRKNCWLGVMACFSLLSTQRSRDLYKCFVSCSHMFSEFPIVSHGFRMFHHQMFPIFWPYVPEPFPAPPAPCSTSRVTLSLSTPSCSAITSATWQRRFLAVFVLKKMLKNDRTYPWLWFSDWYSILHCWFIGKFWKIFHSYTISISMPGHLYIHIYIYIYAVDNIYIYK